MIIYHLPPIKGTRNSCWSWHCFTWIFLLWKSCSAKGEVSCRAAFTFFNVATFWAHSHRTVQKLLLKNDHLSTGQMASHVVFLTIHCFGTHARCQNPCAFSADVKICSSMPLRSSWIYHDFKALRLHPSRSTNWCNFRRLSADMELQNLSFPKNPNQPIPRRLIMQESNPILA